MPIDAKQIKNLWSYPLTERPYNYSALANTATSFYDSSLKFYNGVTDDGYAVGNMGSFGSFVFPFFDIPETKTYNLELTYACGHVAGTLVEAQIFESRTPDIITTVSLPVTGGWQSYQTVTGTIVLKKGTNLVRIRRGGTSEGFDVGKLRVFETSFGEYVGNALNWYRDRLIVTTTNHLPALTKTPTSADDVFLFINGQVQDGTEPNPCFSLSVKTLTLNLANIEFDVEPGYRVVALYKTEE
ncbi:carbohydrate-binding protein [Mastigocladus laminosus UU774]|nr:carbohydrate-binding protein [Mastigocladus laminosus UU774]